MTTRTLDAETPTTVIRPSHGWGALRLDEVWEYRHLVYFLILRDVKSRYRQMALGPLWYVLNPLFSMVLNTLIFGVVARLPTDGVPYPIFNYSALLPWGYFLGAVNGAVNSLFSYRNLISKVYFPRLVVPLVGVLSGLVDFAIQFVILIGMMLIYGYRPRWAILTVPLFLIAAAATALAVGLFVASWRVHYRDVGNIMRFVMHGWMYATPVVYAISMIPERWRLVYRLNPMTNVIQGFRWALLGVGQPPDWISVLSVAVALPILVFGAFYFRRTERTIVDYA
jgi:lipopolysaccharide transport system permease protein